jgi:hypothetical protein
LEEFGLLHWVIAFVKDENINLAAMATTLHSIMDFEPLKILRKRWCLEKIFIPWEKMCKLASSREIDVILFIHVLARNIVFFKGVPRMWKLLRMRWGLRSELGKGK